jgi:hypothetical protein
MAVDQDKRWAFPNVIVGERMIGHAENLDAGES